MSTKQKISDIGGKLSNFWKPDGTDGNPAPFKKRSANLRPYRKPYYVALVAAFLAALWLTRQGADGMVQPKLTVPESGAAANAETAIGGNPPGEATRSAQPPQAPGAPAGSGARGTRAGTIHFANGDKLKIAVYERLDVEEDKWGASKAKGAKRAVGFQIRPEFSGEFQVGEDGEITIPVLGSKHFSGRYPEEVQDELAQAFEEAVGRRGYVNISLIDRQPVYVVGPVKNPGAYKHSPGMTILQAMALAGGLDRGPQLNWQLVDSTRESDKRDTALERVKRLTAKQAVLTAERDKTSVATPKRLVEVAGEAEAAALMSSEAALRHLTLSGFQSRERTLSAAVELVKAEIETLNQRLGPLEASIKIRSERTRNFDHLREKGLSNANLALQAQAELLDLQGKREDVMAAIAQAKRRLAIAEEDKSNNELQMRSDLEKEIASIEVELPLSMKALKASENVLSVMRGNAVGPGGSEAGMRYEILRKTASGQPQFVAADITTALEVGDVVYVHSEKSRAN